MLYPQNGDRVVTIDCVTLLHPICILTSFFSFSYYGAVVSALRALLHITLPCRLYITLDPRLL